MSDLSALGSWLVFVWFIGYSMGVMSLHLRRMIDKIK